MLYKIKNGNVNINANYKLVPPDRISRNMNDKSIQINNEEKIILFMDNLELLAQPNIVRQ